MAFTEWCGNGHRFAGFGQLDRSFRLDVCRDIRPKTSLLGSCFLPEVVLPQTALSTTSDLSPAGLGPLGTCQTHYLVPAMPPP